MNDSVLSLLPGSIGRNTPRIVRPKLVNASQTEMLEGGSASNDCMNAEDFEVVDFQYVMDQIARCRRLAYSVTDPDTRQRLLVLAEQYRQQADEIVARAAAGLRRALRATRPAIDDSGRPDVTHGASLGPEPATGWSRTPS
jgi:hypothetical protein